MRYFFVFLLSNFFALPCFSDIAFDGARKCERNGQVLVVNDQSFYCLIGSIDSQSADKLIEVFDNARIDYLVVSSWGGSVQSAFRIGNSIKNENARIVVRDICYSSCANYLIPASNFKLVRRMPGAVIGIHGSVPRNIFGYTTMMNSPSAKHEGMENSSHREFVDTVVHEEVKYFSGLSTPEEYVKFFNYVRPWLHQLNPKCVPEKGVVFVPDEKFLQAFGIAIHPHDWPMQDDEIMETLDRLKDRYSIYVGPEIRPIWLSDVGKIRTKRCLERDIKKALGRFRK